MWQGLRIFLPGLPHRLGIKQMTVEEEQFMGFFIRHISNRGIGGTAIQQYILTDDEPGMLRTQKGANRAEFL